MHTIFKSILLITLLSVACLVESAESYTSTDTTYERDKLGRVTRIITPGSLDVVISYEVVESFQINLAAGGTQSIKVWHVTQSLAAEAAGGKNVKTWPIRQSYIDFRGRVHRESVYFDLAVTDDAKINNPMNLTKNDVSTDGFWSDTDYVYDDRGNLHSVKDAAGNITSFDYDDADQLKERNRPGNIIDKYSFNAHGMFLSHTDPQERKTQQLYDLRARVVGSIDPAGLASTVSLDKNSRITAAHPRVGKSSFFTYKDGIDLEKSILPSGIELTHQFANNNSEVTVNSNIPNHPGSKSSFDAANLKTMQSDAAEQSVFESESYFDGSPKSQSNPDERGNVDLEKKSDGRDDKSVAAARINGAKKNLSTVYEYDKFKRVKSIKYPGQKKVFIKYTNNASQVYLRRQSGSQLPIEEVKARDKRGNVIWYKERNIQWVHKYDALGRLKIKQQYHPDPDVKTEYFYEDDGSNRYDKIEYTRADQTQETLDFDYDALGRLTHKTFKGEQVARMFDAAGMLLNETINGKTTTYKYDPDTLQRTEVNGPKMRVVRELDTLKRLKSITRYEKDEAGVEASPIKESYEYDYVAIGTAAPSLVVTTHYENEYRKERTHYDIFGSIYSVTHLDADEATPTQFKEVKHFVYTYDESNNNWRQDVFRDNDGDGVIVGDESTPHLCIETNLRDDSPENQANGGFSTTTKEIDPADPNNPKESTRVDDPEGRTVKQQHGDGPVFRSEYDKVHGMLIEAVEEETGIAYNYDYYSDKLLLKNMKVTYPDALQGASREVEVTYEDRDRIKTASFKKSGSSIIDIVRTYNYAGDLLDSIEQQYHEPLVNAVQNFKGKEVFSLFYDRMDRLNKMILTKVDGQTTTEEERQYFSYDRDGHLIFDALKRSVAQNNGYLRLYGFDGFDNRTNVRDVPQADALYDQSITPLLSATYNFPNECVYLKTHIQHNVQSTGGKMSYATTMTLSDGSNTVDIVLRSFFDGTYDELYLEHGSESVGPLPNGDVEWTIVRRADDVLVASIVSGVDEDEQYLHIPGLSNPISSVTYSFATLPDNDETTDANTVLFNQGGQQSIWHGVASTQNEISKAANYDGWHRLDTEYVYLNQVEQSRKKFIYDGSGHIYRIVDPLNLQAVYKEYTYDILGRLIAIDSDIAQTGNDLAISYNAASWQRSTMTDADGEKQFTWFNSDLVRVQNPDGTQKHYAGSNGSPLWTVDFDPNQSDSGVARVYTKNYRGDVTGTYGQFDAANEFDLGKFDIFQYDADGNITKVQQAQYDGVTANMQDQNLDDVEAGPRYRGYWYEGGSTKHYHLQNRHYEPSLARFLQLDPAKAGMNWYAYAGGDPVNRWDPRGLWDIPGLISEFTKNYGDNLPAMAGMFMVLSRYSLEQGNFWLDDWSVDHGTGQIFIAATSGLGGERSNENAAAQLYEILGDEFGELTGMSRSFRRGSFNVGMGGVKIVGGGLSMVGGGLLLAAPEPTGLTKVGGYGGLVFGGNLAFDGSVQFTEQVTHWFGADILPEGGFNPLGELAGLYGRAVGGREGEKWARGGMAFTEFFATLGGQMGLTKFGRLPVREAPAVALKEMKAAFKVMRAGLDKSNWVGHINNIVKSFNAQGRTKTMLLGEGGQGGIIRYIKNLNQSAKDRWTEFVELRPESLNFSAENAAKLLGKNPSPVVKHYVDKLTLEYNLLLVEQLAKSGFVFKVRGVAKSADATSDWLRAELEVLERLGVKWEVVP